MSAREVLHPPEAPNCPSNVGCGVVDLMSGDGQDESNWISSWPPYGVPTVGSLGITSASQIGVLFNATEPMGDSINVLDVTLKFYDYSGTLLAAD